jgi:hypothetical protein
MGSASTFKKGGVMHKERRAGRCIHCGGGVLGHDRRVTEHAVTGMAHKACAFQNNGLKAAVALREFIEKWVGANEASAYWSNVSPPKDWALLVLKSEAVLRSMYTKDDWLSSLRRIAIVGVAEEMGSLLNGSLDYIPKNALAHGAEVAYN